LSNSKKIPLHWQIIAGLTAGVVWAIFSANMGYSDFTMKWINPFGIIFINLLKLIAVPLILFSIIKGIGDFQDLKALGRLGMKTLALYLSTTVLAVGIGLMLVNIIKPGEFVNNEQLIDNRIAYELWLNDNPDVQRSDTLRYLTRSEYAGRIAIAQQNAGSDYTQMLSNKAAVADKRKHDGPLQMLVEMVPDNIIIALGTNTLMLQVIFFALFFGVVLIQIERTKVQVVYEFVSGTNEIFLKMIDVVMKGAPFFVFCLMAGKISELAGDDPGKMLDIFKGLSVYALTVVVGLFMMVAIIYPTLVRLLNKNMGYKKFFTGISEAQMLAFSTSSSAATLPVTMECVNNKLGVPKKISSFVLPIGATVNMDGTSLYISVATVFLAQFHLIDLTFAQQLTIVLTATLASVGASAVPSAGLIMMVMVLQSVGLNPAWIALIIPVDRILDMCRTVVNVTGDAAVASIVANGEQLSEPNE
jgi:Na+/H+-dicarboxylate symporter